MDSSTPFPTPGPSAPSTALAVVHAREVVSQLLGKLDEDPPKNPVDEILDNIGKFQNAIFKLIQQLEAIDEQEKNPSLVSVVVGMIFDRKSKRNKIMEKLTKQERELNGLQNRLRAADRLRAEERRALRHILSSVDTNMGQAQGQIESPPVTDADPRMSPLCVLRPRWNDTEF